MARVEMLKCDECGVMAEITTFIKMPSAINKPDGWYVVIGSVGMDIIHFCSLGCLKSWAHRKPEPKVTS